MALHTAGLVLTWSHTYSVVFGSSRHAAAGRAAVAGMGLSFGTGRLSAAGPSCLLPGSSAVSVAVWFTTQSKPGCKRPRWF